MAEKVNFSKERLNKATCPKDKDRAYIYDSHAPGLALCVTSTGSKTYYVYRWNPTTGQPTRVRLGGYEDLSIEQARKLAVQTVAQIAQGKDITADRRKARDETTLGELFTMFLEGYAKAHKRTWQGDQDQFDRYLVGWQARRLSSVKKSDIASLHSKIGKGAPYAANRMLALLSSLFNYAVGVGYAGGNPCKGIRKFKEQSRDRFLRADEIRTFFVALADEVEPWPDLFTLALLTGARRSNVLSMRWCDLELQRGLWKISETESKNKEPLLVVLHSAAVEILNRRANDNAAKDNPSDFVFPSHSDNGHITETKGAWKRIIDRAGIKDIRLHDLRRTLGSWQAATGASLSIIGRSLGHKNISTTAIYARLDIDPIKASVNAAGDAMMAAANGEPKALPNGDTQNGKATD